VQNLKPADAHDDIRIQKEKYSATLLFCEESWKYSWRSEVLRARSESILYPLRYWRLKMCQAAVRLC
jgi:hypothetical protein